MHQCRPDFPWLPGCCIVESRSDFERRDWNPADAAFGLGWPNLLGLPPGLQGCGIAKETDAWRLNGHPAGAMLTIHQHNGMRVVKRRVDKQTWNWLVQNGQICSDNPDAEACCGQLWQQNPHPNINGLMGAFQDMDNFYLIAPQIGGSMRSLARMIAMGAPLLPQTVVVANALFAAAEHMERHNVVHLDIALDNICLDQNGTPKVMDFGNSRRPMCRACARVRRILGQVGKTMYMPPEVLSFGYMPLQQGVYCWAYEDGAGPQGPQDPRCRVVSPWGQQDPRYRFWLNVSLLRTPDQLTAGQLQGRDPIPAGVTGNDAGKIGVWQMGVAILRYHMRLPHRQELWASPHPAQDPNQTFGYIFFGGAEHELHTMYMLGNRPRWRREPATFVSNDPRFNGNQQTFLSPGQLQMLDALLSMEPADRPAVPHLQWPP